MVSVKFSNCVGDTREVIEFNKDISLVSIGARDIFGSDVGVFIIKKMCDVINFAICI